MSEEEFDRRYRELIRKYARDNTQAVTSTRSQVVVYWLQGWTYVTIAKSLQISRSTVSKYLQDACTQFDVPKLQDLRVLFDRYKYIWNTEDPEQISTEFDNLPICNCQQPIGREKDIDRVLKLIDNHNIVWLKAMGGCGKTTTILAVANRCKNERKLIIKEYLYPLNVLG
jgi:DNA-binding CsgD family transcriptional regulator